MARLSLRSIKAEATALGLEKVGYTSYYVDGANGSDLYDGLTWETPFATIQHAVDESGSWAKIYVKGLAASDLSANANAAQKDVVVTSSADFLVGQKVDLYDNNASEINEIDSITGNTLTMTTNLANTYATAASAKVRAIYNEIVNIEEENIHIKGEKKETTVICEPLKSWIVYSAKDHVEISDITSKGYKNLSKSIGLTGNHSKIYDCNIEAKQGANTFGSYILGDYSEIYNVFAPANICPTVAFYIAGKHNKIHNCLVDGCTDAGLGIHELAKYSKVYENNFLNCSKGVHGTLLSSTNSIFHNNFIGNTTQIREQGTNKFFENYYDDHIVDTNNDGLCDTPYTFTTGTDYTPVSKRNGWLQESLGITPSSSITIANIYNAVNAILTLTETGATLTTDGTVQNLYINDAPAGIFSPKKVQIDFTNQTATETVVIRESYRIKAAPGAYIEKDAVTFAGVQSPLLKNVILEENRFGTKVTIEKTGGTNRDYDWEVFYEI